MISDPFFDFAEDDEPFDVVEAALLKLAAPFGVVSVGSAEMRAAVNSQPFIGRLLGKRDTEYVARYRKGKFAERDVATLRVLNPSEGGAFYWQDVRPRATTFEMQEVFGAAAEHGYRDGLVIPHYGPDGSVAATSFMGDRLSHAPTDKRLLHYAGVVFYDYVRRNSLPDVPQTLNHTLTKRQTEIAYWVAQGKKDPEIADIMNRSVRTVHRHMEDLRSKFGVSTRAELIAKLSGYNQIRRSL